MSRRDHGLDDYLAEGGIATIVAEGIVGLSFEYYADGRWSGHWPSTEFRAPEAVRVIVAAVGSELRDTDAPLRPLVLTTVVPIRVNQPTEPPQQPQQPQPPQQQPPPQPGSPPGGPPR